MLRFIFWYTFIGYFGDLNGFLGILIFCLIYTDSGDLIDYPGDFIDWLIVPGDFIDWLVVAPGDFID